MKMLYLRCDTCNYVTSMSHRELLLARSQRRMITSSSRCCGFFLKLNYIFWQVKFSQCSSVSLLTWRVSQRHIHSSETMRSVRTNIYCLNTINNLHIGSTDCLHHKEKIIQKFHQVFEYISVRVTGLATHKCHYFPLSQNNLWIIKCPWWHRGFWKQLSLWDIMTSSSAIIRDMFQSYLLIGLIIRLLLASATKQIHSISFFILWTTVERRD